MKKRMLIPCLLLLLTGPFLDGQNEGAEKTKLPVQAGIVRNKSLLLKYEIGNVIVRTQGIENDTGVGTSRADSNSEPGRCPRFLRFPVLLSLPATLNQPLRDPCLRLSNRCQTLPCLRLRHRRLILCPRSSRYPNRLRYEIKLASLEEFLAIWPQIKLQGPGRSVLLC
jgi:hypothetical protein